MKSLKFALVCIKKNLKNEKELKGAFFTSIIGMCINNIAFVILWYSFGKLVGNLNGWEPMDIFGLYAFSAASFGLVNSVFSGLAELPRYITTGNFDKYLLTPKSTLVKVITSKISTSAIGDLVFGIVCFVIFTISTKLTFAQILLCLLMFIITSVIFFAFMLVCMTISFYFMDGENISNGIYHMGISASLYHGGAFTGILRIIFIYIMPSLLMGAVPVELIKNTSVTGTLFIIALSLIWLGLSIVFFYKSLKKYESNNFFGFGG